MKMFHLVAILNICTILEAASIHVYIYLVVKQLKYSNVRSLFDYKYARHIQPYVKIVQLAAILNYVAILKAVVMDIYLSCLSGIILICINSFKVK